MPQHGSIGKPPQSAHCFIKRHTCSCSSNESGFRRVLSIDRDLIDACLPICFLVVVNVPHSEDVHLHKSVHAIQLMVDEPWHSVASVVSELHPPLTIGAARHGITVHSI